MLVKAFAAEADFARELNLFSELPQLTPGSTTTG